MPLEMALWRVDGGRLRELGSSRLDQERRLEDWIVADPSVLGMQMAIIARQVQTAHGGRIDILALDADANLLVLELKRERTPRDVIAQLLDYGSWVRTLNFADLDRLSQQWQSKALPEVFESTFGAAIPETVNASHILVLVAQELDDSSERIINYLADQYGVSINAVFFSFFQDAGNELMGRAWLRDPTETIEQADSGRRAPWLGEWYVNVGEGPHRNWDDNRKYGYIGAGQGEKYSRPLRNLKVGDRLFAYMKGLGYVGYGEVVKESVPIADFTVEEVDKSLLDLPLEAPHANENSDIPALSEWTVAVKWIKAYPRGEAKTFKGVFVYRTIVCKLRDPRTLQFLHAEFGAAPEVVPPNNGIQTDNASRCR